MFGCSWSQDGVVAVMVSSLGVPFCFVELLGLEIDSLDPQRVYGGSQLGLLPKITL